MNVTTLRNVECKGYVKPQFEQIVSDSTVCTDNEVDRGLASSGISGYGLVRISDGKLIGVGTLSIFEDGRAQPDIYSRVSSHIEWIRNVIKRDE